jgi:DNA-binding CsgD family transcriptional regulator
MNARTRAELHDEVLRFTQSLEFERFSATVVLDDGGRQPQFISVCNPPAAYTTLTHDRQRAKLCPVSQHCKHHGTPIVWDRSDYVRVDRDELWEGQAGFGYRTGIALALHLPEGRHVFVGVNRHQPLPADPAVVLGMVARLSLFVAFAQDSALRLLAPPVPVRDFPALTPRELESLRWTMEGKTAWEVGVILSISEQTAVRHLNNATHKLGCVNKHQAVVKALRLGLIR